MVGGGGTEVWPRERTSWEAVYLGRMRYLVEAFAVGALRRGAEIEQFLGPCERNGARGVAWVEIWPREEGYEVMTFAAGGNGVGFPERNLYDLGPLPGTDADEAEEDYIGRHIATAAEPLEALQLAESMTGAVRTRWVNRGLGADEYADYVRAGSPSDWPIG